MYEEKRKDGQCTITKIYWHMNNTYTFTNPEAVCVYKGLLRGIKNMFIKAFK